MTQSSSPASFDGYGHSTDVVPLTWDRATSNAQTVRERVASVRVRFTTAAGETKEESCPTARVLRDKSCIVPMMSPLVDRSEVTLFNGRTNAFRTATVSLCGPQMPDGTYPVALDLAAPDPSFWGSGNIH